MVDRKIVEILVQQGVGPVMSLPCKMLAGIISEIERQSLPHIPVCREEEGVGIAAGASLAGKRPLLVMQNSGLGNSINAIMSLTYLYKLPLFLLMSHRGVPGEQISAQIPMGKAAPKLLKALGLDYVIIKSAADLPQFKILIHQTFSKGTIKAALFSPELWHEKK